MHTNTKILFINPVESDWRQGKECSEHRAQSSLNEGGRGINRIKA